MASSSGTSLSASVSLDERKRKRMQSNRESARRSRKRKQKQLDDLMAQVGQLRNENNQIIRTMNTTRQHYLETEAENSVLRVQHEELSYRLEYMNQIISNLSSRDTETSSPCNIYNYTINESFDGVFNAPYSTQQLQPIMASSEMFQY